MKTISLYVDKGTILNKIAPESKIWYVIAAISIPALMGIRWAGIGMIAVSAVLLLYGKVLRRTLPFLGVSGFVLLTVLIIQGMFWWGNETPLFALGPAVFYVEGLRYALGILINIINILMSFCVLILTTKPSDMMENFVRRGFSPRFGYVFISVFQIIPQMTDTMSTITDAQRSRGMETEGSLVVRIKAFIPLIVPVIMSSLINTKERALALEVRGFNSRKKKTFLNEEVKTAADRYIQIALSVLILAAMIWRITQWLA